MSVPVCFQLIHCLISKFSSIMKKNLFIVISMMMVAFLATSCGPKTPEPVLLGDGSLTEQTHGIIVLTCRQGISHFLQQYICRLCQKRHRTQQESEEKKSQGFHFKVYIVKQPEISQ